jgi:glycosyltransferase involved in cell wall biosynthesis
MSNQKLNILFLTYQGGMAGSTFSISFLAKGLADNGHKVFIGIREEMPIWDLTDYPGIERVPMRIKGKFDFKNWREIKEVVLKNKIHIINAQSSHDRYTSIFSNLFFGLNTKVVHTRRQMPMSIGGALQNWLYNSKTAGIVAVSNPVKAALVKLGIRDTHIKVIANGTPKEKYDNIDLSIVANLKKKFKIEEGDFVIGCISRPKEQEQILEALKLIDQPVKLIFAGISNEERYTRHIKDFPAKHEVFFEGNIDPREVLNYYKLFTIDILASTMEGLSQSLLEAMALGTPVIGTAFAGNLDLIQDGVNGLLFENGNVKQLAEKIEALRDNPVLRDKLIQNGKHTALETFSIEKTISNYEAYFLSLLS